MPTDREERIRQRAYEIWERDGRPTGRDAEHWERAAAEIDGERETAEAGSPAAAEQSAAPASAPEEPRPRRRRAAPKGDPGSKPR